MLPQPDNKRANIRVKVWLGLTLTLLIPPVGLRVIPLPPPRCMCYTGFQKKFCNMFPPSVGESCFLLECLFIKGCYNQLFSIGIVIHQCLQVRNCDLQQPKFAEIPEISAAARVRKFPEKFRSAATNHSIAVGEHLHASLLTEPLRGGGGPCAERQGS